MKKSELILFLVLIVIVYMQSINAETHSLNVTTEHPFLKNGHWVNAADLNVGDRVISSEGKEAVITSINGFKNSDQFNVYNLESSSFHNFIVLGNVVVHNSNNPLSDIVQLRERVKNPATRYLSKEEIETLEENNLFVDYLRLLLEQRAKEDINFRFNDNDLRGMVEVHRKNVLGQEYMKAKLDIAQRYGLLRSGFKDFFNELYRNGILGKDPLDLQVRGSLKSALNVKRLSQLVINLASRIEEVINIAKTQGQSEGWLSSNGIDYRVEVYSIGSKNMRRVLVRVPNIDNNILNGREIQLIFEAGIDGIPEPVKVIVKEPGTDMLIEYPSYTQIREYELSPDKKGLMPFDIQGTGERKRCVLITSNYLCEVEGGGIVRNVRRAIVWDPEGVNNPSKHASLGDIAGWAVKHKADPITHLGLVQPDGSPRTGFEDPQGIISDFILRLLETRDPLKLEKIYVNAKAYDPISKEFITYKISWPIKVENNGELVLVNIYHAVIRADRYAK